MKNWSRFSLFLHALFHRPQVEDELDEELRFHLQSRAEELSRSGMAYDEAMRRTRLEFGGVQKFKEECREAVGAHFLETLAQDVRYALRTLGKSPGFAAVALLTLALGIGANTAIFSVVDALLLRPLPYRDASSLVLVWESEPRLTNHNVVSPPDFLDWKAQNHVFRGMTYFGDTSANLTGGGAPQQVIVQFVAWNFFDVLGVKPMLGRSFDSANGKKGGDNAVVLSYGLWQSRFAGNPAIVGHSIEIDGSSYTVLGVAPPDFDPFIAGGSLTGEHPQLWTPFVFPATYSDRSKVGRFLTVVARLKTGVSVAQAQVEMNVIAARLAAKYPDYDGGWGVKVVPMREEVSGAVRPMLLILLGAVGFVLLIACANVASLSLSRAAGRKREMAVRAALGASRWRIARQLLAESVLLAFLGGGLGVLLALWGTDALLRSIPSTLLNLSSVVIDWRILFFVVCATFLSGILFGLLPSYAAAHSAIAVSLQEGGRSASPNRRSRTLHGAMVVAEIALALVLLAGSGLLIESFVRLIHVDPGFDAGHLLTFKLNLPDSKYKTDASDIAFYRELLEKLEHLPGVRAAGMENLPPFSGFALWGVATDVILPGQASLPVAERPDAAVRVVGGDYFRTMGIPVAQGRTFSPEELAEEKHAVIVNKTFVRQYFPQTNPLGQKITIDMKDTNVPSEIVGVVGDVHGADLSAAPWPTVYWPYPELAYSRMTIVMRSSTDPLAMVSSVRQIVRSIDANEPISNVASMDQLIADSVARSRFTMLLLAVFAALALALACIGIYGVMAYTTAQRRNEIGIRMALGAQRRDVLRLVLGQGARMALLGVAIGLAGALILTRLLAGLLFNVSATDPLTFVAVPILLLLVALAACYIPARRAMRTDPMDALRYE